MKGPADMLRRAFVSILVWGALLAACAAPAILGGPTGPSWCPNGTVYGPNRDLCCPDGYALNGYGKCEATPAPVSTTWLGRHHGDAGDDSGDSKR